MVVALFLVKKERFFSGTPFASIYFMKQELKNKKELTLAEHVEILVAEIAEDFDNKMTIGEIQEWMLHIAAVTGESIEMVDHLVDRSL